MGNARNVVVSVGLDRLLDELIKAVLSSYGWCVFDPKTGSGADAVDIVLVAALGTAETVINRLRYARTQFPAGKIVLLGAEGSDTDLVRFIEEGACARIPGGVGLTGFFDTLQMVRENRASCSGRVTQLVLNAIRRRSKPGLAAEARLTPREEEILRLIRDGLSNKEIADRIHISPNTVKNHVHHLLEKLKVKSRHEAAWMQPRPLHGFLFPASTEPGEQTA